AATAITDKIAKADAGIVIHDYSGTYDANSHGVTATITGVDTAGTAAGTSFSSDMLTNVPGGTVKWSLTGGTNYNDASGNGNVTYNGLSHTATATATGVDTGGAALGTSFNLSGTTHTNAGTYTGDAWNFSGGTNYKDATGTVDDSIAKALLTIKADDKQIVLHAALPTFTVTPTGFVNGETQAVLGG